MSNSFASLFDPSAFGVVICGTLLATLARCGWRDLTVAITMVASLGRQGFDEQANRVAIARTIRKVERDGPLCADPPPPPDTEMRKLFDIYFRKRCLETLRHTHKAARVQREIRRVQAARAFETAGELAPIFGLVGTLYAITGLAGGEEGVVAATMASLATAVLSTLYGVLSAHLVFLPLAMAIDRQGEHEEQARDRLVEWLTLHLSLNDIRPAAATQREAA